MGTPKPPGAVHNDDYLPEPTIVHPDLGEGSTASHTNPKLSDVASEGGNDAVFSGSGIAEELRALKAKISELESLGRKQSTNVTESQRSPQQTEEMEQYQRMAKCLYSHRKEWEATVQEDDCDVSIFYNSLMDFDRYCSEKGGGPWRYEYLPIYNSNAYKRPNPFNPSHKCPETTQADNPDDEMDEYDHVVDYGVRRSHLRKIYEWEMDRLWLSEETETRRRSRVQKAQKEASKAKVAKCSTQDTTDKNSDGTSPKSQNQHLTRSVNWHAFKQLGLDSHEMAFCAVDILIGDPVVFDDWGFAGDWFRSPQPGNRADKKGKQAPSLSSQSQLPERIRVHSTLVLRVLDKILKFDGDDKMAESEKPIVFTRPFKTLSHCERGLDSWLLAMEKRARRQSTKLNEVAEIPQTIDEQESHNLETAGATDSASADEVSRLAKTEAVADKDTQSPFQSPVNLNSPEKRDGSSGRVSNIDKAATQADLENSEDEDDETHSDMADFEDIAKSSSALEELRFFLQVAKSQILIRREYLNGDKCHKVFFSDLWHLFRPGLEVIHSDGKQAYRVIHVTTAKHRTISTFQKWAKAQDEEEKKPRPDFERRDNFSDVDRKDTVYNPGTSLLRRELILRGRKFLDAIATKHMFYAGSTLDTREDIEGQVVVDFEAAFNEETLASERPQIEALPSMNLDDYAYVADCDATCCLDDRVVDDTFIDLRQAREYVNSLFPKAGAQYLSSVAVLPQNLSDDASFREICKSIQEDELLILSFRVFGFILRNRRFAQLDLKLLSSMTSVEEIAKSGECLPVIGSNRSDNRRTAFDRLVLEDGHKSMIESLISQHFRDKESKGGPHDQVDVVKGKGKGLILLLHGAPGVGKTSTAGDLGTTAKEVEQTLESNFALANRWGCILLLDEADVFLAERTKEDFVRNGLVAVFLRVLEYYSGILFLTTNRVGDFDEAFTSRIHMSLYYPELSEEKTRRVFKINMDLIRERFALKKRQIIIEEMDIGAFATQHYINHPSARWNGRQIRNACQTALALAEYQAQGGRHDAIMKPDAVINLAVEHFETVRDAYLKFAEYMNRIYGTNAARKAKEGKLRAILIDENDNVVSDTRAGGRVERKEAIRKAILSQAIASSLSIKGRLKATRSPNIKGLHSLILTERQHKGTLLSIPALRLARLTAPLRLKCQRRKVKSRVV
ncbi:ATPase family AAA domain-containing protein 3B [Colletotrichum siamense]|nr:ATPase family AAA domain-containing protein 3B [Colletotrichum siamense]